MPQIGQEQEPTSRISGCIGQVGPVGLAEVAARLIETEPLDAALLDATLSGKPAKALADELEARGVPFAFSSGPDPSVLPEGFRDRPLLVDPSMLKVSWP